MRGKTRIVLVDDSQDFCECMRELLELEGFQVQFRTSGRALLDDPQVLRGADILICDYYMPDMNGVEVIAAARALVPGLPAALLTGSREPHIVGAAAKLTGGCALLYKPVEFEDLVAAIDLTRGPGVRRAESQVSV